jgi:hypothetical protein
MTTELQRAIESGFESLGHYLESLRDFDRVLDCLDRNENISEETKEKYHQYLDEIGIDGVFELAKNTNELFKELGINSYRLQRVESGRKGGRKGGLNSRGRGFWQTHPERLEDIFELKYGKGLTWKDTTAEMNEKYGEDWTTNQVTMAYRENKDLLNDEEE